MYIRTRDFHSHRSTNPVFTVFRVWLGNFLVRHFRDILELWENLARREESSLKKSSSRDSPDPPACIAKHARRRSAKGMSKSIKRSSARVEPLSRNKERRGSSSICTRETNIIQKFSLRDSIASTYRGWRSIIHVGTRLAHWIFHLRIHKRCST